MLSVYRVVNGVPRLVVSTSGAAGLATADTPGLVRPDGRLLVVDAFGVLRLDIDALSAALAGTPVDEAPPEDAVPGVTPSAPVPSLPPYSGSPHGSLLYDASGAPVAVVLGSQSSGGDAPWEIFGRRVWLAVALASCRTTARLGWNGATVPGAAQGIVRIPGQLSRSNTGEDGGGDRISIRSTEENMDATVPDDAAQDSRAATDALLASGAPVGQESAAARFCRSVVPLVNGVPTPMDLPRVSVLMRVYQSRDTVDAFDDIAQGNRALMLGSDCWGSGTTEMTWSSSVYGPQAQTMAFTVTAAGTLSNYYRSYALDVVPCLEIPV